MEKGRIPTHFYTLRVFVDLESDTYLFAVTCLKADRILD